MNLADLLDDLADTAPAPAVTPDRLWAAGRRRRRRRARRARAALVAVAAVGVLALLLPSASVPVVPTYARMSSAGVDGHPERIGRQWFVRDLPDRPGPVAALLEVRGEGRSRWHAVRADGHRWRLPRGGDAGVLYPALSPDGTVIGYLEGGDGPYVLRDLTTGRRTELPELGDNRVLRTTRYGLNDQSPAHWSPDGRHVLLIGFTGDGYASTSALLLVDVQAGTVTALDAAGGFSAGWTGDDRFVTVDDAVEPPTEPVTVLSRDLSGRVLDRVPLEPAHGVLPDVTQWTASVSADGVLTLLEDDLTGRVRRFDLVSGREVSPPVTLAQLASPCGASQGSNGRTAVPVTEPDGTLVGRQVLAGSSSALTAVPRQLGAQCLVYAADALAGPGRGGGLLGTTANDLAWFWRELLLGALALGALLVAAVRFWRRPRPLRGVYAEPDADRYA